MSAAPELAPVEVPEFSLRRLAREVWDELPAGDYHVLAKEMARA